MEKDLYPEVWLKRAEKNDILNETVDPKDFSFEELLDACNFLSFPEYILESVEHVPCDQKAMETRDNYKIFTQSGLTFILRVTYYFGTRGSGAIDGKRVGCTMKQDRPGEAFYKTVKVGEKALAIVSFADEQERTHLTGEVKLGALEVFKSVKIAVGLSFEKFGYENIEAIAIRIRTVEEARRLRLYTAMVQKFFPEATLFVDRTTEADRGITLLVAKK